MPSAKKGRSHFKLTTQQCRGPFFRFVECFVKLLKPLDFFTFWSVTKPNVSYLIWYFLQLIKNNVEHICGEGEKKIHGFIYKYNLCNLHRKPEQNPKQSRQLFRAELCDKTILQALNSFQSTGEFIIKSMQNCKPTKTWPSTYSGEAKQIHCLLWRISESLDTQNLQIWALSKSCKKKTIVERKL